MESAGLPDVIHRALGARQEAEAQGDFLTAKGFFTANVDTEPALALLAELNFWE